jgi:hypothetical protein
MDIAGGMYNHGCRDKAKPAHCATEDLVKDGNNNPVNWVDKWGLSGQTKDKIRGVDINLFNPDFDRDKKLYINIQKAPHPSGTFIVADHSNQYVITDNRDVNNVKRLSPSELATMIKEHPNYTPGDSDSYAQNLANSMGSNTVVYAPDNYLTASYREVIYIGPHRTDEKFTIQIPELRNSLITMALCKNLKGDNYNVFL